MATMPVGRYTSIRVWKDGVEIHGIRSLKYTEERPDKLNPDAILVELRFETTDALETTVSASQSTVEVAAERPALPPATPAR